MKKKLVVLSGAGISAESGLQTFRDSDGLWEGFKVEEVATPEAFNKNPQMVLDFYNMRRRQVLQAQPNDAHKAIAQLQNYFDVQVVTQNIDDLHERAGSQQILHLHGEIFKMRSVKNRHQNFSITEDIHLGHLAEDGGQLRPDIVWFGEAVPAIEAAASLVAQADYLLVIGTSLVVYPAAGLVNFTKEDCQLIVVDKVKPQFNWPNDLIFIEGNATEGMIKVMELLLHA